MNFSDYLTDDINEAKVDITKKRKSGYAPEDLLVDLYNIYKTNIFQTRSAKLIRDKYGRAFADMLYALERTNNVNRNGKEYQITTDGETHINNKMGRAPMPAAGDDDDGDDKQMPVKGVKDITKLKARKFIVPKVGNNSKYLDQMKKILFHMGGYADGVVKTTYMLAGDPGTGKTSFIKSLSTLTGIPLVVIEAPHITQEHLINIPFIVLDGPKRHEGQVTIDDSPQGMKVVQAESNLVTQLKSKRKRTDEQIQKEINKSKVLRDIQPVLRAPLNDVKGSFNSILFLDEFYRTSSIKIRNVLRNILNGKIGNDKIPKGVYIIMATNIDDDGVEDIPLNQDFHLMDYDISSKDDFMSYMYGKFVTDVEEEDDSEDNTATNESGISIKPEVWNAFMNSLTDGDLGFNDENSDTRLSPRRLEQMIISIDALFPLKDEQGALQLIAFIRNNLSNYLERSAHPGLLSKFIEIGYDLINDYNPEIDIEKLKNMYIKDSDWRNQLKTEVELKLALGNERKYVPVVSGQPGIGKTTQMISMAKELEMGFIQIDVSNLTPEDITGMPIANMGDDTITTDFSEPNLYITIMKDYNEQIESVRQDGRKYNIVLLFDEMNRASVPVFNSIRKVLLEKEFEHVKLPDDIIVTGAINPNDIGALEFTSHTRDVLDIIPSSGNFSKTINYISTHDKLKGISEKLGFDIAESVSGVMSQLAIEFQSENDTENNPIGDVDVRPFYWSDGSAVFYVSPREMTEACTNACVQVKGALLMMNYDLDQDYSNDEYDLFIKECVNVTAKSFVDSLNNTLLKQDIQDFGRLIGMKITGNEKFKKMFESIRTKKSANVMNLVQILESAGGDINFLDKGVIGNYIKDFSSTEIIQDVSQIVNKYIDEDGIINAIEKMIDLTTKLTKTFDKLDVSNIYADQLNKHIGPKIIGLLETDDYDLFDLIEKNPKVLEKLEKLI